MNLLPPPSYIKLPESLTLEAVQEYEMPRLERALMEEIEKHNLKGSPLVAALSLVEVRGDNPYGQYWTLVLYEIAGPLMDTDPSTGTTKVVAGFKIFASFQYKNEGNRISIWPFERATYVTIDANPPPLPKV